MPLGLLQQLLLTAFPSPTLKLIRFFCFLPLQKTILPIPSSDLQQTWSCQNWTNGYQSLARTQAIALQGAYFLHPLRAHCSSRIAFELKRDFSWAFAPDSTVLMSRKHGGNLRGDILPDHFGMIRIKCKDPIRQDWTNWPYKTELCPHVLKHVL